MGGWCAAGEPDVVPDTEEMIIEPEGGRLRTNRPRPRRRSHRRLSAVFSQLAVDAADQVSVSDILDALGDRGFAAMLVFFAALNLLPLPPGTSAVLGLPLLFVAAQMCLGARRAWMPAFIARKALSAEQFRALMARVVPRLKRLERLIAPRYWPFWNGRGDAVIGMMALVLSIVVVLPIPLGNWLPAFSIFLLGLALSERDGVLFALGTVASATALGVVAIVVGAAGAAADAALGWIF